MMKTKKIISALVLSVFFFHNILNVFALTNKETLVNNIDILKTNISKDISIKEALLTQKAYDLSNLYDKKIKELNINPDDVDILLKANKINILNFRQEIQDQFISLKQSLFSDIKNNLNNLTSLKDEVSIWYSEISFAQKTAFDEKIKQINANYTLFLSGSTENINNFYNVFSLKIDGIIAGIQKWISENLAYISFIQNIKSKYQKIESNLLSINKLVWIIEKDVLQKLQNNIVFLKNDKNKYTQALNTDLNDWIKKALEKNSKLKKYESSLKNFVDNLMQKWQQYLDVNFSDDENLFLVLMKAKNIINSEKDLRLQIYDSTWNIRFLELSETWTLMIKIDSLSKDLEDSNLNLNKLIALYWTGNVANDRSTKLKTDLYNTYKEKYALYQDEVIKYMQTCITNDSLEEKALSQSLKMLDLEEEVFKWSIDDSMKFNILDLLVNNFNIKIDNLIKNETNDKVIKKAKSLKYKYENLLVKKLLEEDFGPNFDKNLETKLRNDLNKILQSIKEKLENDSFYQKLEKVLWKIDKILIKSDINKKKQFMIFIIKSTILENLQNMSN